MVVYSTLGKIYKSYKKFTFNSKLDKSFFDLDSGHVTYHLRPRARPAHEISSENSCTANTKARALQQYTGITQVAAAAAAVAVTYRYKLSYGSARI